jgi:hypothetical protein
LTKINPEGNALVYSTYLGGTWSDVGTAIAVDKAGNTYITGYTDSSDFPTQNPIQGTMKSGAYDAFVAKMNSDGTALIYSTFLGGSSFDYGYAIAVDANENAYITGQTGSADFPTRSPIQETIGSGPDAFVTKIDAAGAALVYSTYLGGSGGDGGNGIAVDSSGNAYVTGYTYSTNFPPQNPIQGANAGEAGSWDAFVAKIDAQGAALVYSTYLGGNDFDEGYAIAVDASGNAHIAGITTSVDFPAQNPVQVKIGGLGDAFVTKIDAAGTAFVYSTYLGGSNGEEAHGIAVDASGNAYIIGDTYSGDFPTRDPIQRKSAGGQWGSDAFVTRIETPFVSLVSPNRGTVGMEISIKGAGLGKRGKVVLQGASGRHALKVRQWNFGGNGEISALLKKAVPPGAYDVVATTKGGDAAAVTDAFTVQEAVITSVVPNQGTEDQEITVKGQNFGTKVTFYLEDKLTLAWKKCKGVGLSMDKTTGESWAKFHVPKKLLNGTYNLILINNLGQAPDTVDFIVGP